MHKHARNLAANWLSHGATMVVLFFLSPLIVHTLGMVEYGLWSLLDRIDRVHEAASRRAQLAAPVIAVAGALHLLGPDTWFTDVG